MRTRPIQSSSDPGLPVPTHIPVLLQEALTYLDIKENDVVVDATLGGGGHAREIAARLGTSGMFAGFDLDHAAIERAQNALKDAECKVELFETNFREMGSALPGRSVREIDKALFDLGWSSFQLTVGRGFSFNTNDPLVMTYATQPAGKLTARDIVNLWSEETLSDVLYGFGEERFARRIARAIVEEREKKPIETADELAHIVSSAVPASYRHGKLHPATKTFQAMRMAVNDELGSLQEGLAGAWSLLKPGGKIGVISFHSVEDRLVKQYFARLEKEGQGKRVTKKPVAASKGEALKNPRARSAKLRVIEKNREHSQNTFE